MNTRRSYLDNVNAGRQRRPEPRFEDLDRTLAGLEGRSDRRTDAPRAFDPPHPASRHEFAERPAPRPDDSRQRGYTSPRDLRDLARDMDTSRRQEEGLSSIGRIAGELKAMREELRQQMGTGLRREFDSLRGDLQRVAQVARSGQGSELSAEFDRLSDAVRQLSERSDDKSVNMLRLEVNQMKDALETLAREDTVRSADRRWDEFDRKWNQLETRLAGNARSDDSAVGGLKSQLADIGKVLNGLPDTGLLRSMEERLQKLAGSIEQFGRHSDSMPAAFSLIEQRLDEITRAIAATATPTAHFDPQPFERVEARISALAHQIDELVEDQSSHVVIDRLNVLSQRVDDIAQRVEIPEIVVDRLASQIAAISEQIERRPGGELPSALIHGIEDRFEQLADMVDRRQGDASEQGRMLFREMERRLDEVAQRLEERQHHNDSAPLMAAIDERFADLARRMERQGGPDRDAIESLELRLEDISKRIERAGQPERNMIAGLETRLEEISRRIEVSARQSGGIDPEIVRNLESQVASLTSHLAQPSQVLPEFEDIGPRLAHIERSLTSQRDSILDAAREAAREAVGSLKDGAADPAVSELAQDLRSLDQLTRRSDERNAKTFEAVHDTLLKIVDRLGSIEQGGAVAARGPSPKLMVPPPALDGFDDDAPSVLGVEGQIGGIAAQGRSPSQAAAAAARHALGGTPDEAAEQAPASRLSVLSGLTRAFRKDKDGEVPTAPALASEPALGLDEPLDPRTANQPLEPGSGAPDLNAIMRRVREERAPGNAEAAKSDFIAAARRAAQAAAAEAQHSRRSGDAGTKAGKLGGIGGMFKVSRKTVMLGATALIVVLAGLQIGKAFLGGNSSDELATAPVVHEQPLKAEAMPTTEAPANAAPLEAKTASLAAPENGPVRTVQPAVPANLSPSGSTLPAPVAAAPHAEAPRSDAMQVASLPQPERQPAPQIETTRPAAAAATTPADTGPEALREAADGGDPKAMFEIAGRYAEGRGVKADLAKAAVWYRRAAETGFAPAEYRLGNFYEKGTGVERDAAQARNWYEQAAKQGNVSAMHNLAVLYAMGADGKPNNEQAARWFIEAAELGVKDSQYNLGILAAKGAGLPQNLEESYKWFALVANAGDRDAGAKRDEVAKALRPEQLTRARQATDLWKPREPVADANAIDIPDEWTATGTANAAGAGAQPAAVDMRQAIFNIQTILNKNGYDAGSADGKMGQKTKNAIVAFQTANGLKADGEVNDALVKALLARK